MGYYSTVALAFTEKGQKYFKDLINASPSKNDINQLLKDADRILERDGCILYSWNSIKWYHVYPEIAFIHDVVAKQIPDEEFYLVRVGETYSDVEEQGNFFFNPFCLCASCELSYS